MSPLFRSLPSSVATASRTVASSSSYRSVRALHILPPFDNLEPSEPVHGQRAARSKKANVFLPKAVVKRLSKEYHQGLLDRLNEQVRGTKFESLKIMETIHRTAQEPELALTFNYASNALNNAFFLSGLRQEGNPGLNRDFTLCLIKSFGSLRDFEEASARTIDSMTSSGWLWLVKRHHADGATQGHQSRIEFRVSYAAGTVVSPSRIQSGVFTGQAYPPPPPPPPEPEVPSRADETPAPEEKKRGREWSPDRAPPPARYSGPASTKPEFPTKKKNQFVTPLACLSLHERSYLDHFGHGGRLEYFRQWLHALDYDKLMARVNASGPMVDYEAGEDNLIEVWQASAESVTPAQVQTANDALERAWQHDQNLIAQGEQPVYQMPRSLDMQYKLNARTDQAYYYQWATGTLPLKVEPEADEPAASEEASATTGSSAEEDANSAAEATEEAAAPVAEATQSAPTPAEEAEATSTSTAATDAATTPAESSASASAPVETAESAPADQTVEGEAAATKPSEGASGSQSSP